jgi:peptidoglycan/LPS O-acetylase OafA/YrhL
MRQRDHSLDFLKIAATLLIIMHHYQELIYASGKGFFYGGHFYWGRMVELFFILSGYMMYRYQDRIRQGYPFKLFYLKRAFRLLPMTALAAVVYEILAVLYKKHTGSLFMDTDLNLSGTLFDALGIQAGWASINPKVNNPTWYISVLMLCYLIFYLINKLAISRKTNVCYFYIAMVFIGIGILSYDIKLPFLNFHAARGYYSFFTGILLANLIGSNRVSMRRLSVYALVISGITAYGIYYFVSSSANFKDYMWLTLAAFPSVIVIFETRLLQSIFRWSGWSILARASFDMYLWHICVDIIIKYLLIAHPSLAAKTEWKMMLSVVCLDVLIGLASYLLIEKRMNRFTDKILRNPYFMEQEQIREENI